MSADATSPTAAIGSADLWWDAARQRHEIRERLLDPKTISRLQALGVQPGWHCLELAAGSGSIARWLADAVGERGRVVATEIDLRFLQQATLPNLEVRRHDVLREELEADRFDLVHCRGLLMVLPMPEAVLQRMVGALKPGGWLLVEEADFGSFSAAELTHPAAGIFHRVVRGMLDSWHRQGLMDAYVGRRLPGMLGRQPLQDVGHEGTTRIHRGGEEGARFYTWGLPELLAQSPLRPGTADPEDLQQLQRLFWDPTFSFVDYTLFAAWGRRTGARLEQ